MRKVFPNSYTNATKKYVKLAPTFNCSAANLSEINTWEWSWNGTWKFLIALIGESRWENLPFLHKTWGFLLTKFTINPIKDWRRSTLGFDNHQIQSMHECDGTNLSFPMKRAPILSATATFYRLLKDVNFHLCSMNLSKYVDEFHVWFNRSLIYPRTSSKLLKLNVFEVYHWTNHYSKAFTFLWCGQWENQPTTKLK